MKIVVLDAYALNPGDLSWAAFDDFGDMEIYERTKPGETASRIKDAQIVLTNKTILDAELIRSAKELKYIGVMATGYNVVDVEAARGQGIPVSNIPAYSTASVAQLTFAYILAFATHVHAYAQSVREGEWERSKDFSYMLEPVIELKDKTLGIVGLGQIGQAVARIALAFDMKVIASHRHPQRDQMQGVEFVEEKALFQQADFVSLHVPLREQNDQFVNAALLKSMKPTAYLINTSRGGLIHEQDLADALHKGVIAGAGLDVLSKEPPTADNPLLKAPNVMITPHIAWASKEARVRLMDILKDNISSFLAGAPQNIVN